MRRRPSAIATHFVRLLTLVCLMFQRQLLQAAEARGPTNDRLTILQNSSLRVTVEHDTGTITVYDRRSKTTWPQPAPAGRPDRSPYRDVTRIPGGVRFTTSAGNQPIIVSVRLIGSGGDMSVETDQTNRDAPFKNVFATDSFLPATRSAYLAVADYCDGHLYPLDLNPFPRTWMAADRLDMPWFGVSDTLRGPGYVAIIETSDDACVDMQPVTVGGVAMRVPRIGWLASRGTFAYPRRILYRFIERGGYVAMAKAYRDYARQRGLLVSLRDKARRNPNVTRLYGAVDVWGDASLTFAREAHSLGVRRMLIHGQSSATEMRAVNALGYLTSEYDNYTDILPTEPGKSPDSNHDHLPDAAVLNSDGTRMKAWLTYDKRTQYMKRCPSLWESRARSVISDTLKRLPFLGRFIDVTTAEALYECHDPKHPLSRTDKRRCGEKLLGTVSRLGLVAGGEHGIWWAVPHLSYIEGMLSSYQFAWPAGHLIRPKSRTETFDGPYNTDTWDNYERWGIGHAHRVPLWQLVFHDCVVSTWYWGDSNDFLLDAAPEITDKKDAFNVLYGTMPMLWANAEGSWHRRRPVFLRTANIATAVHRAVADLEMTSHEFLTADRSLQRTLFADGTQCYVNFGAAAQPVRLPDTKVTLPKNGFIVRGPKLRMSRTVKNGHTVTTCRTSDWSYREEGSRIISAWQMGSGRIGLRVTSTDRARILLADLPLSPRETAAIVYPVQPGGRRMPRVGILRRSAGVTVGSGVYEVLYGRSAQGTDHRISAGRPSLPAKVVKRGTPVEAILSISSLSLPHLNAGHSLRCTVTAYADRVAPGRALASRGAVVPSGRSVQFRMVIPTDRMDGDRTIVFRVQPATSDLCMADNEASLGIQVRADPRDWQRSATIAVEAGNVDRTGQPIVTAIPWTDVDPGSVRVFDPASGPSLSCPTQVDNLPNGRILCFLPKGEFKANTKRVFRVVWNGRTAHSDRLPPIGARRMLPSADGTGPSALSIRAMRYSADLQDGVLRDLAVTVKPGVSVPIISKILASSAETGWTDEAGISCTTRVVSDGPVRTVIEVRKALRNGVSYVKEFSFYDSRLDVRTRIEPRVGIPSRAFYAATGNIRCSTGTSATIDGRGDAEGMTGGPSPALWYEVLGDRWSHSCVTLSTSASLAYWDSSEWGGVGFVSPSDQEQVVSYRFYGGAMPPGFGALDRSRLAEPAAIRISDWRNQ